MSAEREPGEVLELAFEAVQPSGAGVAVVGSTGPLHAARVLVAAIEPCGQCDVCRRGGAAVCPALAQRSTDAPRTRVSSRWVVPLGDGLELPGSSAAAVPGDVATAYTLYARTGLQPRDPVVVTGATAVARFLVEILRAKSITPVALADAAAVAWCDELRARGALVATSPAEIAAHLAAQGLGARPWRLIATDGAGPAAALCGPRATLTVLAGGLATRDDALPAALIANEVAVIGVAGAHPDLIVEAAALCARGEIDLAGGVTHDPADRTRALVTIVSA